MRSIFNGGDNLCSIDCKIRLTKDKIHCIIESVISFELSSAQYGSEESTMPIETITLEEIQRVYKQIGITEITQQASQPTELNPVVNSPVPSLYSQVSLVYSDSATT